MKSILLLIMLHASPFAFSSKVVSIHDGDTITLLQNKTQIKVKAVSFKFNYKENCRSQKLKYILRLDRSDTR